MDSNLKTSAKSRAIYPSTDPQFAPFPSRRSVVHSTKGIVSSTQPLASQCGLKILQAGGNCADAAVATAAGLNMTEPGSTGIGGDMFCLFYNAKTKKVHALNGSGRSGEGSNLEQMRRDLHIPEGSTEGIPMTSVHAVTVPGAAAGWVDTVAKFGSGKLSMEQILAPAIELGEKGFPVSELSATFWANSEANIRNASPSFSEILKKDPGARDGCRPPEAGEIMKNPTLSHTFRVLAKEGKKGFYEGAVAEAVVKVVRDLGGHLTMNDLRDHMERGSEEVGAISLVFNGQGVSRHGGIELWEHPPNGQGIVALMALGMLEQLEKAGKIKCWEESEHNSAEQVDATSGPSKANRNSHLHAVIEVLRIAFADANWWVADPNVERVPTKGLISPDYLAQRASLFDPKHASDIVDHGSPAHNHSDTVYFAVTDADGNAMSFINSNYGGFGTCIVPKGCGFTLQNRGANFSLSEGHPNVVAPRKRPYHTIIPAMLTNPHDGSLNTVYGVMGGFMQPQGHLQVLLNMMVFGLSPQAALDAPRVCIGAVTPKAGEGVDRPVFLEEGIREEVAEELRKRGHQVSFLTGFERGMFGRGQVIRKHEEDGQIVYSAGSDQRGDGAAFPLL